MYMEFYKCFNVKQYKGAKGKTKNQREITCYITTIIACRLIIVYKSFGFCNSAALYILYLFLL